MNQTVHILHLEDDPNDAELVEAKLSEAGLSCRITLARTRDEFGMALNSGGMDIILADYRLPTYDGMSALRLAKERQADVPFIFVSGMLGEEAAIEALTQGATDYVLKQNLSRLASAVQRALKESQNRRERKQTQEKLEKERSLLRCLIDAANDLIFIKDQDSIYRACNKASEAFIGIPENEQIGKTDYDFFDREKAEEIRKADKQVIDGGKALHFEEWVTGRDGRRLLMDTIKTPYYDPEGNPLGLVGIGRDITERELLEKERLANLRYFESMDRINRVIQGAKDLEQMIGDVLETVLAIFDSDRAYLTYPCDPDAGEWSVPMERYKPEYSGAFAQGSILSMNPVESENIRILLNTDGPVKSGPGCPYTIPKDLAERFSIKSFMALALRPKLGKPWRFGLHQCAYTRDWTPEDVSLFQEIGWRLTDGLTSMLVSRNLQESELRNRSLVENFPDFIARFDTELRFLYVNPEVTRASGFPLEDFVGKRLSERPPTGPPDQIETLEKKIREAIDTGKQNRLEFEWSSHEGERYFDVVNFPERDEKGTIVSILTITRDITELKRAERERISHLDFFKNMDRINRIIQGAENLEQMMSDVLDAVLSIFDCDRAYLLYPCDPDSPAWFCNMERNKLEFPGSFELNLKVPMDPQVAESFRILLASDGPVAFGPGTPYALPEDVSKQFGFKCYMGMAIYPKSGSPWQFGIHQCSHARIWTPEEKRLFQEIGRRITDGLTGLLTYRDLMDSEKRFRTLLENIPACITRFDENNRIVYMNRAVEKFFGDPVNKLVGRRLTETGRPGSDIINKKLESMIRDVFTEGVANRTEDNWLTVDGIRVFDILHVPEIDKEGKVTSVLGISSDITDRKKAEEALALKNRINEILLAFPGKEMYREVLQVILELTESPYGYFGYLDEDGGLVVPTLTGEVWERCQVPGKSIVFPRESWGDTIWGRVIREKRSIYSNIALKVPDGHIPIKKALGVPMIYQEVVVGHFLVANRETEYDDRDRELLEGIADLVSPMLFSRLETERQEKLRKRSEAETKHLKNYLSNIIDSMPSMLVGIDKNEIITQWNRHVEMTTGIPAEEAVGKPVKQMFPDLSPQIEAMLGEIRQHRPAVMEKLPVEKEEVRRLYDLMLYPLLTNGTEGAVLRIEDVTEQARIQNLMIQTEKMMSLGGLAAGMAHEINNPLGIITQAAQNLERRIFSDLKANLETAGEKGIDFEGMKAYFKKRQIPEFIGSIREASRRASRIIENILKFSRGTDSAMQPASLVSVIDQALELAASDYDLKKKYDFKSIEILRDYEPGLPAVSMVSVEMEQVILNLLKNSAQAVSNNPSDRKPRIILRLMREERYVLIEVADNGHGMDEKTRLRVFEPFYTTKEPGIGTGLGLSVAYMIVTQNHKGLMEVESTPGNGTSFRVRLPLG